MNNSQKLSKPIVRSSNSKKKPISKAWMALIFVFSTLVIVLIITTISLHFYEKEISYSSPQEVWNPEKDLEEFIVNNFSDYYRPDVIQPTQSEGFPMWEYSWGVVNEDIDAFVRYNEDNNYINRVIGIANLNQDIVLDKDSAVQLSTDVFDSVISKGAWDCGSLGVELSANPLSDEAPLNDVTLTAVVSGTVKGEISYKFDCTSDGTWEKEIITDENPYIAVDLCNYLEDKDYSARVMVRRGGMTVLDNNDSFLENTIQCRNKWISNKDKYEIIISKLKGSQFISVGFCIIPNNSNYYENENCF